MLRATFATLVLMLAAPALASADTADQKAAMKETRAFAKDVDRAVAKWNKGLEKGNDAKMARAEADVQELVATELRRLRAAGVPTRAPVVPEEPTRVVDGTRMLLSEAAKRDAAYRRDWAMFQAQNPPSATPVLDAYRDDLVALRDLQAAESLAPAELRRMRTLLGVLDRHAENRFARADARYQRAREAAR